MFKFDISVGGRKLYKKNWTTFFLFNLFLVFLLPVTAILISFPGMILLAVGLESKIFLYLASLGFQAFNQIAEGQSFTSQVAIVSVFNYYLTCYSLLWLFVPKKEESKMIRFWLGEVVPNLLGRMMIPGIMISCVGYYKLLGGDEMDKNMTAFFFMLGVPFYLVFLFYIGYSFYKNYCPEWDKILEKKL